MATNNMQDIQSLQKTEKDLLDNLETDPHLTPEQRQQLIEKINAISDMRLNLYKTIQKATGLYQSTLEQSQDTIIQQTAAVDMEEKALNETKRKLKLLSDRNLQDLRIVEINRYFSEKYKDHSQAALALIYLFIGLIIIHFLYKSGIMPNAVYWALVILLTGYIAYKFWNTLFLMYSRNNMNYDQLDFKPPDPSSIPSSTTDTNAASASTSDPWYKAPTTCIGSACCTSDMVFDDSLNMCVVSASTSTPTTVGTV